jgi:hypothetical protein
VEPPRRQAKHFSAARLHWKVVNPHSPDDALILATRAAIQI